MPAATISETPIAAIPIKKATKVKGPCTKFPADDLRPTRRFVTTHNSKGEGVFLKDDEGDHHKVLCNGLAVANIIYSTQGSQVDLNDEKDVAFAAAHEPPIHTRNGSVARLIDFAPGMESPIHRAMSIDYGIVVEGEFLLTLDSGESKKMLPGDCSVNRGCNHKWKNLSETKSGRMLFVLLDVAPLYVGGKLIEEDLGEMTSDYAPHPEE
ncbi:hypothetical protein VP1G_09082 [Cytospora mali]|uniref:Cupin type-2 domain-containing protein n=1 Tax=Cytospora mali TaxID=578113 RepID=A0A194VDF9_CYTMA|nr:hypothetical protein VP1G_09082 [Valsa mali var. pyri (nom. inval.)]